MTETEAKFECWALVEVMGHTRYAGKVTEQAIGGTSFVRVDVPAFENRPAFTKLLSAGSIFCITPVAEQIARGMAQKFRAEPISVYDLPAMVRQPALPFHADDDFASDDDDSEMI